MQINQILVTFPEKRQIEAFKIFCLFHELSFFKDFTETGFFCSTKKKKKIVKPKHAKPFVYSQWFHEFFLSTLRKSNFSRFWLEKVVFTTCMLALMIFKDVSTYVKGNPNPVYLSLLF